MEQRFYWLYQLLGWSIAGLIISLSLFVSGFFDWTELVFVSVLISSAALFSHGMRYLFKRVIVQFPLGIQLVYFATMSGLGAGVAASTLVFVFYLFVQTGMIDPVGPGQWGRVIRHIFFGNAVNMFGALLLWSAFYVSIVKARQLGEAKEALASSQLQALSQQLNPHFLFNMLNNIRALILENPQRARDALARLADMLRYSLQQGSEGKLQAKVPLLEELAIADEYVALCKIQFEQRLQYEVHVDDRAKDAVLPRLLIQLCIENAIKHGIEQLREGGTIKLEVQHVGETLCLSFYNPCPAYENLRKSRKDTGIGLKNIRERLKLLYGESRSSLRFDRRIEGKRGIAEVHIRLPYEKE
ncbi:transcriptional regulator [Aliidiomarina taiwanensis]|uniref:Transcriptional regulator n=1 Tax=Aliidiomarina taiwanensis TaxID=946228 RepID=A0A432WYQ9_9GAMM|nr:histidine kinase [Aliidiomarina taiwanensis]RUO38928.1 transcriptional regulator [Aliidiomarina taiwanensis]